MTVVGRSLVGYVGTSRPAELATVADSVESLVSVRGALLPDGCGWVMLGSRRWRSAGSGPELVTVTRMSRPPVVVDYDTDWPNRADELVRDISSACAALPDADRYVHEHIGSTSVPGLPAKPIIDLQMRVPRLPDADAIADVLRPIGFELARGSRPDSPGVYRDIPRPGDKAPDTAYRTRLLYSPTPEAILHVRLNESPFAEFVVVFRDWLRAHPSEAGAYATMKRRTAALYADAEDYDDYTRAKTAYFDEIEPRMWAWAATRTP